MNTIQSRVRTLGLLGLAVVGIALLHTVTTSDEVTHATASAPECNDNIDNDNDGDIDFPEDRNCDSLDDNYEGPQTSGIIVSVSDGKNKVEAGENLVYTINVTSTHAQVADFNVRFYIPEHANLVSASNAGHVQEGVIDWFHMSIGPNDNKKLYVNLQVDPNADIDDVLVAEVNASGESAKDSTTVSKETIPLNNKISISVTDGKVYADPEEVLVYRILVSNKEHAPQTIDLHSQIPSQLILHEITGNHEKNGRKIVWKNLKLEPKEIRELIVTGHVERDTPDHFSFVYKVSSGIEVARDTTTIGKQKMGSEQLGVFLTDNHQTATNNQKLTYEAVLKNNTATLMTNVTANANLPQYTEFVSATEGGYWTGSSVQWKNLTISPNGDRELHYTLRVRSDAPFGSTVRSGIVVQGHKAYDITEIGERRTGNIIPTTSRTLLTKTADRSEVQPGDTVAFTIRLVNTTKNPFSNLIIEDKYDGKALRVLPGTEAGGITEKGKTVWNIPILQPGQEWTVQYRMQVHPKAPHGIMLTNIVSANGTGMENIALTDRIFTSTLGVVTQLPKSGAALDFLFLLVTGLLGIAPAAMSLKRKTLL